MQDERPVESVILFCPVCCSPIDVQTKDGSQPRLRCVVCETYFAVVVDVEKIKEYSPV